MQKRKSLKCDGLVFPGEGNDLKCFMQTIFEFDEDCRRDAFSELAEEGFVPLPQAHRLGWLAGDRKPPSESPGYGPA
jgi:hypothetical protein